MNASPAIFAEIFRQCACISALIAGFSFAFLAVILTSPTKKRVDDRTAGFAIAATAGLIVCALGWTFSVPRMLLLGTNSSGTAPFNCRKHFASFTAPYPSRSLAASFSFWAVSD